MKLGESYLAQKVLEEWKGRLLRRLEDYHRRHPLLPGISRAELKAALPAALNLREYDHFLARLQERGQIVLKGDLVSLEGFEPQPSGEEQAQLDRLGEIYATARFQPPAAKEALARAGIDGRQQEDYYSYLVNCGRLVKINEAHFHREAYDAALDLLRRHLTLPEPLRKPVQGSYRLRGRSCSRCWSILIAQADRRVGDHRVPKTIIS